MESKEVEALPKRSKSTQIQSISSKDSVFPMPNLPEELIAEILLKLPVKSLLQFRSVSKPWLSLIFSTDFVNTHLLLSASNKDYTHHGVMLILIMLNAISMTVLLALYFTIPYLRHLTWIIQGKIHNAYPRLVGSINGLICLAIDPFYRLDYLFLWNASIREYKKLPSYRHNLNHHHHGLVHFQFGFAYDEFQDDYKVVGIFPIYYHVVVQIYSLKCDSWKRIDDFKGKGLMDDPAKFLNGKLHWLDKQWNIIYIDLADEKWAQVEQPFCFKRCGILKLEMGTGRADIMVSC